MKEHHPTKESEKSCEETEREKQKEEVTLPKKRSIPFFSHSKNSDFWSS